MSKAEEKVLKVVTICGIVCSFIGFAITLKNAIVTISKAR